MRIADDAKGKILIALLLSGLVLAAYRGVAANGFIAFDDPQYVTANDHLRQGLSWQTLRWAFTTTHASNWHPLTWVSLLIDRELFGIEPAGYHWTSVLLHLLGGLILCAALTRMTAAPWHSAMVAALFLLHPLHVESVAWVAERKDVLCGLFWMAGLWGYAAYAERPGIVRYLGVGLCFICALLAKPMAVTFPFVLLLLDVWPLGRAAGGGAVWGRLAGEKVPLLLLSAAVSVVTFLIQKEDQAVAPLAMVAVGDRLANAVVSYAAYLGKTFWPAGLAVFYPYHGMAPAGELAVAGVLLAAVTLLSVSLAKERPYLLVGWLWYLGTLVPVIGIVKVGSQAMADRYTYLPLIGIFIGVIWAIGDLLRGLRLKRMIGAVGSGVLVLLLTMLAHGQVGYWKDTTTLFGQALANTENNFMAQFILGESLEKAGDLRGAEARYREATRLRPAFRQAYNALGRLLLIQGREAAASPLLEKALEIDPAYVPALKHLGDVRLRQGRAADAIALYRKALLRGTEDPELLNNYGIALFTTGEVEEAVRHIRAAIRVEPNYPEARENLDKILRETGGRSGKRGEPGS